VALIGTSCSRDPQKESAKYLASGQAYMEKAQYGDAVIQFRNAVRADPNLSDAYSQLAHAELAQHDLTASYAALQKAISLDPSRLDVHLDRGEIYLDAHQFDKAEGEANFILKANSKDVGAYQLLGAALMGDKKPEQAIASFSKAIELEPNNSGAYVDKALAENSLHRPDEAERDLKTALSVDPRAIHAYIPLAGFYKQQNRIPEAEQLLQLGTEKNPDEAALYLDLASMTASQGKNQETEAVLDRLRKRLPDSKAVAIAIGDFYAQRKEIDPALREYHRGLTISYKDLDIRNRMQDLYLLTGQVQPATDADRDLLKDAPKDLTVRLDHARLLMAEGKSIGAVAGLQKVVAEEPNNGQAHYYLAMAFWQNGELWKAKSALEDALKCSPGLPVALQAIVKLSVVQGDLCGAEYHAQELIQNVPSIPANHQLLADVLTRQGQYQRAEQQLIVAKQLAPRDPTVHLNLAQTYSLEKKLPEAQAEFESAFALDPHNTLIFGQWVNFLTDQNQSAKAEGMLHQYINANPDDAQGHILLGNLDFETKRYGPAQTETERAVQINPKSVIAYLQLGRVEAAEGQPDPALAAYEKALDLQPKSAPVATLVGNGYLDKNDLETARKYYVEALAIDPNFAIANANLAWVDAQENRDLDAALKMAQQAKSAMPEVPTITDTLGWVMYKKGIYSGAIRLLSDCVEKAPSSANFHYHLGMAFAAAGEKAKGKDQLKEALKMNLSQTDEQQARQELVKLN
jgi:tetratricopeptide (TPR) repeat protein